MNAGQIDRYVSLRQLETTLDEIGASIASWTHAAFAWGRWLPSNGREVQAAQNRVAEAAGVLRLRYRTDVQETWRVVVDGKSYEIVAPPVEVGRRDGIDLILKSVPLSEPMYPLSNIFDIALPIGSTGKDVIYPAAFQSLPQGLYVQLVVPTGQPSFTVTTSNESASGFTATFGAAVPSAGYKLSVQAFQSRMAFTVDLAEGDSETAVTFTPPFPRAPRGIKAELIPPIDGFEFTTALVVKSLTKDGFTLEYGAEVPGLGYKVLIQVSL